MFDHQVQKLLHWHIFWFLLDDLVRSELLHRCFIGTLLNYSNTAPGCLPWFPNCPCIFRSSINPSFYLDLQHNHGIKLIKTLTTRQIQINSEINLILSRLCPNPLQFLYVFTHLILVVGNKNLVIILIRKEVCDILLNVLQGHFLLQVYYSKNYFSLITTNTMGTW
jgi:hypothetical protein